MLQVQIPRLETCGLKPDGMPVTFGSVLQVYQQRTAVAFPKAVHCCSHDEDIPVLPLLLLGKDFFELDFGSAGVFEYDALSKHRVSYSVGPRGRVAYFQRPKADIVKGRDEARLQHRPRILDPRPWRYEQTARGQVAHLNKHTAVERALVEQCAEELGQLRLMLRDVQVLKEPGVDWIVRECRCQYPDGSFDIFWPERWSAPALTQSLGLG